MSRARWVSEVTKGPRATPGLTGANGAAGPVGAQGIQGVKGEKGDPGRDAAVTCKVKGSRSVVCSVVFVAGQAKLKASSARLTRNGRTYAKGSVARLRTVRKVVKGGYSLRVGSGQERRDLPDHDPLAQLEPAASQHPAASPRRASPEGARPAARPFAFLGSACAPCARRLGLRRSGTPFRRRIVQTGVAWLWDLREGEIVCGQVT